MRFEDLQAQRAAIYAIADRYGVTNIRVFGSVARGEADDASDVDLLVDLSRHSLFALGGFKSDMEALLATKVDVVEEEGVHAFLRQTVVEQARVI